MKPKVLNSSELLDNIINALDYRVPCSVVSLGATETFVLAQNTVLSIRQVMNHAEAKVANLGLRRGHYHRGVRFPNLKARDALAEALRKVDIVGYNLLLRDEHSGLLTEKVFDYYGLWPKYTFESYIRRVIMFSQREKFERMLAGRKILLISGFADEVATSLQKNLQEKLGFQVAAALKIFEFEEIPRVKKEMACLDFDLCLLAAGLNAIILAAEIAGKMGKVAFDLGQGMESLITGGIQDTNGFLSGTIKLSRLFKM